MRKVNLAVFAFYPIDKFYMKAGHWWSFVFLAQRIFAWVPFFKLTNFWIYFNIIYENHQCSTYTILIIDSNNNSKHLFFTSLSITCIILIIFKAKIIFQLNNIRRLQKSQLKCVNNPIQETYKTTTRNWTNKMTGSSFLHSVNE
jgi:hypothetical protein